MKQRVSIRGPLAVFFGAAIALVGTPRRAHADDAALSACIAANEGSIQRRNEHKLLDARAQALQCAADTCPAVMRDACKRRVEQVNAALPTIVFDVKDATGADVAAKVSMDGHPLDTALGAAIVADPGEHKFVFEAAGQPPVEKSFILREGEKDRHEPIVVGSASTPSGATPASTGAPPEGSPLPRPPDAGAGSWSTQKTLALVAGGVGVAGIAVGSVFGLMAHSSWNSAQTECPSASNCPQHKQALSDRDSASTSATISTIAFIAGAAAVTGGAVLWFTAPRTESPPAAASGRLRVVPGVGPGSAGVLVLGVF
jgi:hypothetical protein